MRKVRKIETFVNTFHAICFFLNPLKTSENLCFSDVFRGCRMGRLPRNGLLTEIIKSYGTIVTRFF